MSLNILFAQHFTIGCKRNGDKYYSTYKIPKQIITPNGNK
jgi:hypothetical protein